MKHAAWLSLVTLTIGACSENEPKAPSLPQAASAVSPWVRTQPAGDVPIAELTARTSSAPGGEVAITAPLPARVLRVHVRPGQHVETKTAIVDVVMPELGRAAAEYQANGVRAKALEARIERLNALKSEGLARWREVADAEDALAEVRAARIASLAVVRGAGFTASATGRLARTGGEVTLKSRGSGVVVNVSAIEGAVVGIGGPALATVAARMSRRVEARLFTPLPDVAFSARLHLDDGREFKLTRGSSAPIANRDDGTTTIWFDIVNDAPLAQGMSGRLRIELDDASGAVAVPLSSLLRRDGGHLLVARSASGEQREISVEMLAATRTHGLVRGELDKGMFVATDPEAVLAKAVEVAP